ncbi:MAG: hypothetical protein EOO44_06400 [Flavobacterium sp.]|nr:MAG: hypothetical protein EOO44_06400 [Flavobacterium sp.]
MSIMFLSTTDYPSGQIIEFNIESSKDGKNKDIKAINDELIFKEEISFGKIHIRKDNGDLWYINPAETIARFITKDQLELFHKWDKQTLLPTDKQFEILKEIGGLPSSQYSLYPDNLQFPATITTNSGQRVDLCLFHFSQAPPFQRYFKKVLLLSDIADIRPSELALTHDLRLASTLADEIRMSFYPFMVKTNTGKFITYNGITQFASTGEIKGNEIISEVEFSYDNFDKVKDVSYDDITFVIGKWDDRIKELFNQYRQRLERKTATNSTLPKAGRSWWQKLFSSE